MVSKKFVATKMSIPQLEISIQIETESWRHCRRNKKTPTAAVPPSICIGTFYVLENVLCIPRNLKVSRQFSKPRPCFTIHRHHGNQSRRECPRTQLIVFCQKILCKSVQKAICSLPKRGPPRDSQTGWFPRNFWPPKCQLRSRKIQLH